jgi:hypothetical protein
VLDALLARVHPGLSGEGGRGDFTVATLLAPAPLDRRAAGIDSPTGLPDSMQLGADALALAGLASCVVALVIAITGLVHRWRIGDNLRHQQLLWLALAFALPVLFMPLIATEIAQPWMFALVTLPAPVAVGVAILQRRLYDVQWAVSSALTYATLSAAVASIYALTVAGVGAVLDQRGARWLPWLGAGRGRSGVRAVAEHPAAGSDQAHLRAVGATGPRAGRNRPAPR